MKHTQRELVAVGHRLYFAPIEELGIGRDPFPMAEMLSCLTVFADRMEEHEANAAHLAALWNAHLAAHTPASGDN